MNLKLKIGAYAILVILVAWFGWGFHSNYTTVAKQSAERAATNDDAPPLPTTATNAPQPSTNAADISTNAILPATNTADSAGPEPSNAVVSTNPEPAKAALPAAKPAASIESERGSMIGYLVALVGAIIGLGLLITYDATQFLGGRAVDLLFDDQGDAMRDPEYERAEQVWANGKFLEAIQLMRDYLKTHPREQYVALRIAEIYEKDLRNYLAAALENEEVLKHKLPPDRWGWTAIHLCNLYSKLGQQEKTRALLERIVDEYPKTLAAKKARSHLGLAELEEEDATPLEEAEALPEPASPAEEAPRPPESSLPPGFRPKK